MPTDSRIWKAANPERARELGRQANARYREKRQVLIDSILKATARDTAKRARAMSLGELEEWAARSEVACSPS